MTSWPSKSGNTNFASAAVVVVVGLGGSTVRLWLMFALVTEHLHQTLRIIRHLEAAASSAGTDWVSSVRDGPWTSVVGLVRSLVAQTTVTCLYSSSFVAGR